MALAGAFDGQEKESILWRFFDLTSVGVDRCPLYRWGKHYQRSSQVSRPEQRKQIYTLLGIFLLSFLDFGKRCYCDLVSLSQNKGCSLFWSKT